MRKDCKRQTRKKIRQKKYFKRIFNKVYVKWKSYDSSFNSWVDKKYNVI